MPQRWSRMLFLSCLVFPCLGLLAQTKDTKPAIVLHGGAGTILKKNMTPEREARIRGVLTEALTAGYAILQAGGSSLDAVEAAIVIMEDAPEFNAGKGAVFTNAGTNEMDASIMDGSNLMAGAVAAVKRVKNPIRLARMVMERTPHVLLAGEGAETFAEEQGMTLVDPEYFHTERRWNQLEKAREKGGVAVPQIEDGKADAAADPEGDDQEQDKESGKEAGKAKGKKGGKETSKAEGKKGGKETGKEQGKQGEAGDEENHKYGTVGVVALDKRGNLAAGTSTGGLTNKKWGRIGDSPIIGAGTYADNSTCAVSGTGHGEYFMRSNIAYDIAARMAHGKMDVQTATRQAIERLTAMGGTGGVIVLDARGQLAWTFNTAGMYRGYIDAAGNPVVEIYR